MNSEFGQAEVFENETISSLNVKLGISRGTCEEPKYVLKFIFFLSVNSCLWRECIRMIALIFILDKSADLPDTQNIPSCLVCCSEHFTYIQVQKRI